MSPSSLLARLGLDRPELRAWAMYDWAASSMQTTIMVAVFPIYFVKVAGAGLAESGATQRLATVNTIALVRDRAALAGARRGLRLRRDQEAVPRRLHGGGCCSRWPGCASFTRGDLVLASWLFVLALIGVAGSFVFYEALLPHIAQRTRVDRVSTAGYALGYVGGGHPAGAQPGVDPEAGAGSGCPPARDSTNARPRCRPGSPS